jgi:hypothetical protein
MFCFQEVIDQYVVMVNAFGPEMYYSLLKGEETIPEYKTFLLAHKLPNCVKSALSCILGCLGQRRDSSLLTLLKTLTSHELLALLDKQKKIQLDFL